MKLNFQWRLTALVSAMVASGALILALTLNSQRQLAALHRGLNHLGAESAGIMDQFEHQLRSLNSTLLRYGTERDSAAWEKVIRDSSKLKTWIAEQHKLMLDSSEAGLLSQLQIAADDYVQTVWDFHDKVETLGDRSAKLADFTPVRLKSQQLFDLGQALARAHYQQHETLLHDADRLLEKLHLSVIILISLLFVAGTVIAHGIYRQLIAPLRAELGEARARAERREKLASLGLLASGAAREFRSPLTAVKIGVRFQKGKFPAGSPEHMEAEVIEREILRLEQLLEDFLAMTRPAAFKMVPLRLDVLVTELRHFLTDQLAEINLHIMPQTAAPLPVNGDAAQLRYVISHLVQRVADNLGKHACISLRAGPERHSLGGTETEVAVIEVMEKGGEGETTRNLTGNDDFRLGLAMVARIIQWHGGQLLHQQKADRATAFKIVLPIVT